MITPAADNAPRPARMSDRDPSCITVAHPPLPGGTDDALTPMPSSPGSMGSFDTSEVPSCLLRSDSGADGRTSCLCNEHVRFMVDNQHFTVHESVFSPTSDQTRQILARETGGIVILHDTTAVDFERFLAAMRCKICDEPPLSTLAEWTSVLKLAHRFGHAAMREYAIKRLDPLASCVDRVVLAREYAIDAWLPQAYLDVCELPCLPPPEEIHRLGLDVFIKVATAREAFRLSMDVVEAAARGAIVKDIFGTPSAPSPEGGGLDDSAPGEEVDAPGPVSPAPVQPEMPLPKPTLSPPPPSTLELPATTPASDAGTASPPPPSNPELPATKRSGFMRMCALYADVMFPQPSASSAPVSPVGTQVAKGEEADEDEVDYVRLLYLLLDLRYREEEEEESNQDEYDEDWDEQSEESNASQEDREEDMDYREAYGHEYDYEDDEANYAEIDPEDLLVRVRSRKQRGGKNKTR